MGLFLFIDGPASVCGWVNFPILWPHTPVPRGSESDNDFCIYFNLNMKHIYCIECIYFNLNMKQPEDVATEPVLTPQWVTS